MTIPTPRRHGNWLWNGQALIDLDAPATATAPSALKPVVLPLKPQAVVYPFGTAGSRKPHHRRS